MAKEMKVEVSVAKPVPIVEKAIVINLIDKNKPDYVFNGEWAGRDIKVIQRTLARAYKIYQVNIRRAHSKTITVSEPLAVITNELSDKEIKDGRRK